VFVDNSIFILGTLGLFKRVVFFGEGVVNVDMQCLVRCYRIYLFVFRVNAGTWDKEDAGELLVEVG